MIKIFLSKNIRQQNLYIYTSNMYIRKLVLKNNKILNTFRNYITQNGVL